MTHWLWASLVACASAPAVSTDATAHPPELVPPPAAPLLRGQPELVAAARAYLGRPYRFGGRGAELDCMGLVFLAWQDAGLGSWRRLSVMPTRLVAAAQLGTPVPGLSPAGSPTLPTELLAPGDVLFFLGRAENPAEPSLATLDGTPLWVWHMGLYAGGPDQSFVVGDHYAGRVVEPSLPAYLAAHREYVGVYAVRPEG